MNRPQARRRDVTIPEPISLGGRYELVRLLDVGGMANIYLGRQNFEGGWPKELAIKRLKPAFEQDERVLRMFALEGRIGARMDHDNVVRVFETGSADGLPYIAMEFVPGCQLNVLCRAGIQANDFISMEYAVELLRQASEGMAYFHRTTTEHGLQLGVVHCDISPTNLLVTREGKLSIIDFGIAQSKMDNREGILPGKLSYMSPEQVARQPLDARSDIFSLGVVFYEVIARRRLFKGDPAEVREKILNGNIEKPSTFKESVPPELDAILMKMLAQDRNERYEDAANLVADVNALMETQGWSNEGLAEYIATLKIKNLEEEVGEGWKETEESDERVADAMGMSLEEFQVARTPVSTELSSLDQIVKEELRIAQKHRTAMSLYLLVLLAVALLIAGLFLASYLG